VHSEASNTQVLIFASQWLMLPLLCHSTTLGLKLRNALYSPAASWDSIYALTLCSTLIAFAALYYNLYGSDPGFLGPESDAKHMLLPHASPCPYCGCKPSARSRHSKFTGQCVHKFDHSCWLLSTDIGDRNHGSFWVLVLLQFGLAMWAFLLLWGKLSNCAVKGISITAFESCEVKGNLLVTLLGAAFLIAFACSVFFGYLFALHTYLLCTNQTTYEVVTGWKLAYLAPHYKGRDRGKYWLPREFLVLLWDEIWGRGPPKPFNEGIWKNVMHQIADPWPREFVNPL
jgi:DHHC palmitoyltransferase